jgi:hypothetical protein
LQGVPRFAGLGKERLGEILGKYVWPINIPPLARLPGNPFFGQTSLKSLLKLGTLPDGYIGGTFLRKKRE